MTSTTGRRHIYLGDAGFIEVGHVFQLFNMSGSTRHLKATWYGDASDSPWDTPLGKIREFYALFFMFTWFPSLLLAILFEAFPAYRDALARLFLRYFSIYTPDSFIMYPVYFFLFSGLVFMLLSIPLSIYTKRKKEQKSTLTIEAGTGKTPGVLCVQVSAQGRPLHLDQLLTQYGQVRFTLEGLSTQERERLHRNLTLQFKPIAS